MIGHRIGSGGSCRTCGLGCIGGGLSVICRCSREWCTVGGATQYEKNSNSDARGGKGFT